MLSFREFLSLIALCSYRTVSATDYYDRITTQIDTDFRFERGDKLYSSAGDSVLQLKAGGNCVLKDENGNAIWETGTGSGEGDYLMLKYNGNMKIMDAQDNKLWGTGTTGHTDTQPHSLVVYYHCVYLRDKDFTVLWSEGSGCSAPYPTFAPTPAPTMTPTDQPTLSPTLYPTSYPTQFPSKQPTISPTPSPTNNPTQTPTDTTSFPTTLTVTITKDNKEQHEQSQRGDMTPALSIFVWIMCSVTSVLFVAVIVTLILFIKHGKHQAKQNDMALEREIQYDGNDMVYTVEGSYDKKGKNSEMNRKLTNALEEGEDDDNRDIFIQRDESGDSDDMYIKGEVEEVVMQIQNSNDSDKAQNEKQEKTKDDEYYDKHYDEIRKAELNE